MTFSWEIFRDSMIDIYHGGGSGKVCPLQGRGGEDYSNQCAMRHSYSAILAGHQIDVHTANRFAPGGFFTYAGECMEYQVNGRRLARGAANWWNYLNTTGIMSSKFSYETVRVPASISNRKKVPYISMEPSGVYRVDWLLEGEETFAPARVETFELQAISEKLYTTGSGSRAYAMYLEYQSMAQSWEEHLAHEEKRKRYIVVEDVWTRLIRKYIEGEINKPRGFVYYEIGRERPSNPGYHIDGFDIEYFLKGKINHPVLGHDYSTSVPTVRIGLVK